MLGILALAFLLRAFKLTTLLPILVDESIYLRWAEIIDHQNQWFISLLDGKQPLTYWLLAIQRMIWDGDPLAGARLLSVFAGLGSTVGVFAVGRLWSKEIGGLMAAFLYACFPLSLLYDRLAYTEGFVNFFGIAIVFTSLWCFSDSGGTWKRELEPGAALALALLTKQTLLLFGFFALLAGVWPASKTHRFHPLGGPRGPWALPHGRGSESIPGRTDDRSILQERALQITRTLATKHQRAAREPEIS